MKNYYLSEKEYEEVFKKTMKSETKTIIYHGLIIEAIWIPEDEKNEKYELMCTYEKDVLAKNYEWYIIPNPQDYR